MYKIFSPVNVNLLSGVDIVWVCLQLGFIGLVEDDWISTLSTIDPEDIKYIDFVKEGRRLAIWLREMVAALRYIFTQPC